MTVPSQPPAPAPTDTAAVPPPLIVSAPSTTRIERGMGYHKAFIEDHGDGRWAVSFSSILVTHVEILYFDSEDLAKKGADQVIEALYNSEMSFRSGWAGAYSYAIGRENDPAQPGRNWVPAGSPGAPTAVTATAGELSAVVTWAGPTIVGDSPLTGFQVTATDPDGLDTTFAVDDPAATSTELTPLSAVTYSIVVQAVNTQGAGVESSPAVEVTPTAPPPTTDPTPTADPTTAP